MDERERVAVLYREHAGAARGLAMALTGDRALAEDVTQDAFMRCAGRLTRLRDPERFRGYLLRAVIRAVIDADRKREVEIRSWTRANVSRPEPIDGPPLPGLAAELVAGLQALPVRQRTAVTARFLLDWSERQTAAAMGCRVGTVKSLTSRGLASLRDALAEAGEVMP